MLIIDKDGAVWAGFLSPIIVHSSNGVDVIEWDYVWEMVSQFAKVNSSISIHRTLCFKAVSKRTFGLDDCWIPRHR